MREKPYFEVWVKWRKIHLQFNTIKMSSTSDEQKGTVKQNKWVSSSLSLNPDSLGLEVKAHHSKWHLTFYLSAFLWRSWKHLADINCCKQWKEDMGMIQGRDLSALVYYNNANFSFTYFCLMHTLPFRSAPCFVEESFSSGMRSSERILESPQGPPQSPCAWVCLLC